MDVCSRVKRLAPYLKLLEAVYLVPQKPEPKETD
jgi:hypothetical protein